MRQNKDDGLVVLLSIESIENISRQFLLELELLPFPVIFENGEEHSPYIWASQKIFLVECKIFFLTQSFGWIYHNYYIFHYCSFWSNFYIIQVLYLFFCFFFEIYMSLWIRLHFLYIKMLLLSNLI